MRLDSPDSIAMHRSRGFRGKWFELEENIAQGFFRTQGNQSSDRQSSLTMLKRTRIPTKEGGRESILPRWRRAMGSCQKSIRQGSFCFMLLAAFLVLGGCAATIQYSYDPAVDFSKWKNYRWAGSTAIRQDVLVEKNIIFHADQILLQKGYTRVADQADFLITMGYDYEIGSYDSPFYLKMVALYVHLPHNKELVWQGRASGNIRTIKADAASPDLVQAIQKILMNFPPPRRK